MTDTVHGRYYVYVRIITLLTALGSAGSDFVGQNHGFDPNPSFPQEHSPTESLTSSFSPLSSPFSPFFLTLSLLCGCKEPIPSLPFIGGEDGTFVNSPSSFDVTSILSLTLMSM